MILGLDVSTSITGASIIDKYGDLIYCQAWRTDKKGLSFYQKLDIIKENVLFIRAQYPIEMVYVEEPLGMFASGRSSAQIISKIQRFNGATCWILSQAFNLEPKYINVFTARKKCGISVKRGQNSKEIVLKNILESHENFKAAYTKKGNPVKGTYDRADSVVVAKAGHYLFEEGKQHTCYNKNLNK